MKLCEHRIAPDTYLKSLYYDYRSTKDYKVGQRAKIVGTFWVITF